MQPAKNIANGATDAGRRSPWDTCNCHHSSHGLRKNVISGPQTVGSCITKPRNRAINDLGINFPKRIVTKAKLIHDAGTVILHHDVRLFYKFPKKVLAFFTFEIQRDSLFISIDIGEIDAFTLPVFI